MPKTGTMWELKYITIATETQTDEKVLVLVFTGADTVIEVYQDLANSTIKDIGIKHA